MSKEIKEKVERFRAKRGGHRGVSTKLIKEALELLKSSDLNSEIVERCEVIANQLDEKTKLLNEINEEILGICDVSEIENEIEESAVITDRIMNTKIKINKLTKNNTSQGTAVNTNTVNQASTPITNTSQTQVSEENTSDINLTNTNLETSAAINNVNTTTTTTTASSSPKLPKLELPKFRGQVTEWNSFWDSYNSAIHSNASISKVNKFNYLHSLLDGSAARSIKGLTLTNANYDAAIEILQERFGRPQQSIAAHMDEILKIQACTGDRTGQLRYVYDKISVNVRGLASLGVSSEQYGSLLIPIIMSKLPSEIRLQIARKATTEVWKIDELLQTIKFEVEAREMSEGIRSSGNEKQGQGQREGQYKTKPSFPPTVGSFVTKNEKNDDFKIRCIYCQELHYSASCTKVSDSEERKKILRESKRCFVCLRSGHFSHECQNTKGCRNCGQRHHQSICSKVNRSKPDPPKDNSTPKQQTVASDNNTTGNTTLTTATSSTQKGKTVLLQTARCIATNMSDTSKSTSVRVLFDNGSQRTYITNSLKSRLNLKPERKENLRLNTFGNDSVRKENCDVVKLGLRKRDGEKLEISALSFPVICSSLPLKVEVNKYPHIEGLTLADEYEGQDHDTIDILIGSDCYWDIVTGETVKGDFGPTAVCSKLGWLLSGPLEDVKTTTADTCVSNLIIISGDVEKLNQPAHQDDELKSTLKKFWETESMGVRENEHPDIDQPSTPFLKNINYKDNRYEVSLPWKEEQITVGTDYNYCYNRLKSMQHKLRKEPDVLREYNDTIQEQLDKGVVEEVSQEDLNQEQASDKAKPLVHYLPHHAVVRKDKDTTKLRVVYDGSAKSDSESRSLNDFLETGPNFIPHLFDVLIKFRWNSVAVSADIEKAFLMVGINPTDRDVLRFLWLEEPERLNSKIKHLRFCRLVFGLRPSPAILGATIYHHLNSYKDRYPELVELIKKHLYVDDFLFGAANDSEALDIYRKSKEVMNEGGFNLRKWNSNSASLMEAINQSECSKETSTSPQQKVTTDDESYTKSTIGCNNSAEEKSVKVLGVNWNTCSDELFFNFDELVTYARSLPITKRALLKLTAKIFDPLGFLSPFTIQLKVMFQVICSEKIDWDEELQGRACAKFNSFVSDLQNLAEVRIPRCYFDVRSKPNNVQLHGFSDASNQAFAAVVYMRSTYDDGHVEVNLIASKTKVAPTKKQSIPRLELLGALILARLVASIQRSLSLLQDIQTIYWVDSITTLYWIRNNKPWKQYVQHRVNEIRQLSEKEHWRFCPGLQNPADLPSRGLNGQELSRSKVWWNGPEFLTRSDEEWPVNIASKDIPVLAIDEIVKNPQTITHSFANLDQRIPVVNLEEIINSSSFSTLTRLLYESQLTYYDLFRTSREQCVESHRPNRQPEN